MITTHLQVCVIVLNWNNAAHTVVCVKSIRESIRALSDQASVQIIIVDNGSSPTLAKSAPELALAADITLVTSESNLGFSAGMNLGIQEAEQEATDAVWLLNNDTVVDPNALRALVDFKKKHPHKALIGSVVVNSATQDLQPVFGYKYYKYFGFASPIRTREAGPNKFFPFLKRRIDYIDGAAMFVDMPKLSAIGGLPTKNFLYYEELNLAHALGGAERVGVCESSRISHTGGASTKTLTNTKKTYYSSLAALRYTKEHVISALPLVLLLRVVVALARDIKCRKLDHMSGVFVAFTELMETNGKKSI